MGSITPVAVAGTPVAVAGTPVAVAGTPVAVAGKLLAVVCVLVLGAAGCGGSDDTAANRRWARTFCTSLDTWQTSTRSSSEQLQVDLNDATLDPTATKARLTEYLQDVTDATDRLVREFKKAGAPAIEADHEAVRTLEKGSAAVKAAIADAKSSVDAVSVDDTTAFQAGIASANARLSEGFASFGDALDRINRLDTDGELITAERSVAACRPLIS
jgi:hypothetical protein